ncbi:MAG: tubulin-like doman-containing protein, partial [Candidatus Subteraquimicrobiales bacterium]|nr:tubulin-like doman-containing protein [Candidatus Subteraquimicrobiales bacterium]
MIYPTLFIGLGTQGLRILEELQKVIIEEYGEKPPIFEYIYFETDEKAKPEIQTWAKNEIRMPQPFPVISDLKEVRDEFN